MNRIHGLYRWSQTPEAIVSNSFAHLDETNSAYKRRRLVYDQVCCGDDCVVDPVRFEVNSMYVFVLLLPFYFARELNHSSPGRLCVCSKGRMVRKLFEFCLV